MHISAIKPPIQLNFISFPSYLKVDVAQLHNRCHALQNRLHDRVLIEAQSGEAAPHLALVVFVSFWQEEKLLVYSLVVYSQHGMRQRRPRIISFSGTKSTEKNYA